MVTALCRVAEPALVTRILPVRPVLIVWRVIGEVRVQISAMVGLRTLAMDGERVRVELLVQVNAPVIQNLPVLTVSTLTQGHVMDTVLHKTMDLVLV